MKIYRFFIRLSFIGITLFVLLIRPVLGSAQVDYDNGEYYNQETTMFQYDENGNVLIDRDNYNFMEQGSILFNDVPVYDENGLLVGTQKELKVIGVINDITSPLLQVSDTITKFFGIVPESIDDENLYDYIIYEEGHEGSHTHILYDLRLVYENLTGIKTSVQVQGAGAFEFPWLTGLRYYYESQSYWKTYNLGPITINYDKLTENELLEYLQDHYPEYLN
jgi:hypothetical protein